MGEVLTQIAMEGKFEFNAIVVDPPAFDEYDGGDAVDGYRDWTSWALDWTNRADLVAAWFHDNRDRRSKGLAYPFNFYQLSPMLVVLEEKHKPPVNIEEDYFQFMMPFTWELWGAILAMFVVVTVALGFIEGRLFIVPDHLRRQDGQAMKSASLGYNLKAWMTEFFLATMAFCQAGGWWGMSQAKTASGRFLSLFTEFGILIILSAYLGNITNLMLREQQSDLTTYSASSFEDLISQRANICYRERTALGDMMKNLGVVDLGQLVDVGENSGGFSNHTTYGADLMRSGDCDAMVLPEWFAENTLVMNGPNTPCDLRLKRDRIRTVTGGWVTASPYHRLNALTRTNPAATMSDVGCMDVCHHEPNTSLHANSPPPRPYPRFSAPCATARRGDVGRPHAGLPFRRSGKCEAEAEGAHQGERRVALRLQRVPFSQQCCSCCKRPRTASPVKRGRGDTPAGRQQARASPVERQTRNDNGGGSSHCRWQHARRRNRP